MNTIYKTLAILAIMSLPFGCSKENASDDPVNPSKPEVEKPVEEKEQIIPASYILFYQNDKEVSSIDIEINNTVTIEPVIKPNNAYVKDKKWESSNNDVIKIVNNEITAINYGKAIISYSITSKDIHNKETKITGELKINVIQPIVPIVFKDKEVEKVCLKYWDINKDNILSKEEAETVTNIGNVFQKNDKIVTFDELKYFTNLDTIPNKAFQGCEKLVSFELPNSVRYIGHDAFFECDNEHNQTLKGNLKLPEKLEYLGTFSLWGFDYLTSVTFSPNIKIISNNALAYCDNIDTIRFEGTIPPASCNITGWGGYETIRTFEKERTIYVYVPQDGLEKYNKRYWNKTTNTYFNELSKDDYYIDIEDEKLGDFGSFPNDLFIIKRNGKIRLKVNQLSLINAKILERDERGFAIKYEQEILKDHITSICGRNPYYKFIGY